VRPSGHNIAATFDKVDAGGSIPPNVFEEELPSDLLKAGNNAANDQYTKRCKEAGLKIHPARFPAVLPDFFIKLLTDEGDVVVDPFAGSNTTGRVAEGLGRRWLAMDEVAEYLEASKFRFEGGTSASTATNLSTVRTTVRPAPRAAKRAKAAAPKHSSAKGTRS
jgi:site-specific DNA-methyltransferase (cytosine-N4-specific)